MPEGEDGFMHPVKISSISVFSAQGFNREHNRPAAVLETHIPEEMGGQQTPKCGRAGIDRHWALAEDKVKCPWAKKLEERERVR